ncbi:MAG: hypothetical protein R2798_03595 [Chitinophagales bacterium]|nr:hypothetical protein [Bacteroidota bacterium]MCB9043067.1 hypothetical protein [Chitinophagales bacterium]
MIDKNLLHKLFNTNHSYDYNKIGSPIEEILLNHIIKFIHEKTKVIVQYPISTISGNFRADIALLNKDKVVIIECDGEEHHTKEKDDWYDEWRDALILIQKKAHVIYRVKGIDILNNLYSVFSIIYSLDQDLFNQEYSRRLEKVDIKGYWYKKQVYYDFRCNDGRIIPSMIEVKRKELEKDFNRFWFKYILYSLLFPDKNIRNLIKEMSSKNYEFQVLIQKVNQKYPKLKMENEKQLLTMYKIS